jgi:glycogen operon protein
MDERDWFTHYVRSLGMVLNGEVMHEWSESGELVFDDPLLLLLNAHWEGLSFALPRLRRQTPWRVLIDTARPGQPEQDHPGQQYSLAARSLVLLCQPEAPPRSAE